MKTEIKKMKLTPELVNSWKAPAFQRELRVNTNVELLAQKLSADPKPHLPGVITLSILDGVTYLTDGQHRVKAFLLANIDQAQADVRTCYAESKADMGEEFVQVNSSIANLKPDHVLKGLLDTSEGMRYIIKHFKLVGFGNVRRGNGNPVMLSMSVFLRCWFTSMRDVPRGGGMTSVGAANRFTLDEAKHAAELLGACEEAWGTGSDSYLLWNSLNLTIIMWIWRRLVPGATNGVSPGTQRSTKLTATQFKLCLMELAATPNYVSWLRGRSSNEFSQGPCYERIKRLFYKRYHAETGKPIAMPNVNVITGEAKTIKIAGPIDYKALEVKLKDFIGVDCKGVPRGAVAAELGVDSQTTSKLLKKAMDDLWLMRVGDKGTAVYLRTDAALGRR